MSTAEIDTTIIDGYVRLLEKLSTSNKLDPISRLTKSIKSNLKKKKSSFQKPLGALESSVAAEEIIEEKRISRAYERKIEY